MTTTIIVTLSLLLLLAYVFDISASKTRIPSVILLLLLGWAVKQATNFFDITIPDLSPVLPLLGTIGLILIVLEGSLELEIKKEKFPIIWKSAVIALFPLLASSFGLAYVLSYLGYTNFIIGLENAIPLMVISSAIAIPSAKYFSPNIREFVTYESSLSDILGLLIFNFLVLNNYFGFVTFSSFIMDLLLMLVVSFITTLALAFFINRIKHHVKFAPIILLVVLIYIISKEYHLPALIFILLFGLFLGNIDELRHIKFINRFHPVLFSKEVAKFKELTTEFTFLVRSLFFLLFGFLIETKDLINPETLIWAIGIVLTIYIIRFVFLKLFRLPVSPLLSMAPRGLITVLLFLTIPETEHIGVINRSLVIQIIVISAFIMMFGSMLYRKEKLEKPESTD